MTTKTKSVNASKGLPVNHCSGFRWPTTTLDGISRETFRVVVNPQEYGFTQTDTPRTDRSVLKNIELGLAAVGGEKGPPAYDRILVLNAGMNGGSLVGLQWCRGHERAREAIDSGAALNRLMNYIRMISLAQL